MKRLVALCASSALLAGCSGASGLGPDQGLVGPDAPTPPIPAGRTISYRASSFTNPGLDVSPDGQRLYFSAMGEIYVVPITGGRAEPLALGGGWKTRPVISPDSLSIGFLADRGAGIAAWRRPLSGDAPAAGEAVQGYEAYTLAWIDSASLVSAGGSTRDGSGLGPTVDYHGEHGAARLAGQSLATNPSAAVRPPASMSADHAGNVFLQRGSIVRIHGSTGVEDVVVSAVGDPISQPRVTWDGASLGFATMSGGAAHLMLKDLASGETRQTGCRLNAWGPEWNSLRREPSYAFVPHQNAVVLERDGLFYRCTFEGVESQIPIEAEVAIHMEHRIRPSRIQQSSASRVPMDLASTGDGRTVAYSSAGHLWLHDRSTGQAGRISTSEAQERTPAFSSDGRYLAYVERFQDQSSRLRLLDLETRNSRVLVESQLALGNPAWSPDGRQIAFVEKGVASPSDESTLRWAGLDGSAGVVGKIANTGWEPFPRIAWDTAGSAILYTYLSGPELSLVVHPLDGTPQQLLSVDRRVRDVIVSPSGRFVALRTRDAVYVTPILLSSRDRPTFTLADVRAMKRLWVGGADHLQWLADDSLIWTTQNKLMHAPLDEEPREVAELRLAPAPEPEPEPARRAYVGATVISMDQAATINDAVIVTRGRVLEYVGSRQDAPELTGIETTDLSGKWIVPGFIDVHTHNLGTELSEYNAPVSQPYLAQLGFGVTTVFDPSTGTFIESTESFAASQKDDFAGPTIYGSGPPIVGQYGSRNTMDVESYEHALVLASDIARRGGLMIKEYRQGTRQQRQWLAQAALATGLGITSDEDETPVVALPLIMDGYTAVEHTLSRGRIREDTKRFLVESQVSLTPTLATGAIEAGIIHESALPNQRRECLVDMARLTRSSGEPEGPHDRYWDVLMTDYADLLNRGAKVTIGGHGDLAGLDFHWELEMLSMGGATPMNLLRAATMNGAEKLGLENQIGSLVQGKDADFVVLNANPLDDIRNARNIERVVRRGRVVTWPAGPAPQSWRSATSWDDCQSWNFGLGRSAASVLN